MLSDWDRGKRIAVAIGIIGIALEIAAIALLASKHIPSSYGMPLVVTGMFLAFVPIFVLSRRHKGR